MLTAKWQQLGVAFFMVVSMVVMTSPAAEAAAPARILLVGDSITEGSGGDTAYRCDLWEALGGAVDFVGAKSNSGDCGIEGFDADHDGRAGARTVERINEMVTSGSFNLAYDAALVHLGTNDKNGVDADWSLDWVRSNLKPEWERLVDLLRSNNPTVTIYLAQIIPCASGPSGDFPGCTVTHNDMNQVLAEVAAEKTIPVSPIVIVDHREGFTLGDLKADQVHPNASGKAKMAEKWAAALDPQLDDEVLLVEPSGRWRIRRPGQADRTFWYGNPADIPLLGDWNGDGLDTPGAWRPGPGGGYAYLTNSLPDDGEVGVAEFDFFFGAPGDAVFVGDWNGDGIDTLGINRGGHIFLTDTNGSGGQPVPTNYDFWFGAPGDRSFGGDPDGDGRDSVFLYRSADGFVYFTNETPVGPGSVASTAGTFFFGIASDRFVAGDWDGDGVDTAGIFRGSDTTVYLSNTNPTGGGAAPTDESYNWGGATWRPVAGRWKR